VRDGIHLAPVRVADISPSNPQGYVFSIIFLRIQNTTHTLLEAVVIVQSS
jgi:hypothetical protein